jgi:hypothetical protein
MLIEEVPMWDLADHRQRLRLAVLAPFVALSTLPLLAILGVGGADWRDAANVVLDFVTHPESLLILWGVPTLLLFLSLSLLHRVLKMRHEGWRRVSIVVIGCTLVVGLFVAFRGGSNPLAFFYGVAFFALPLVFVVLLLIRVVQWVSEGFGQSGGEASA